MPLVLEPERLSNGTLRQLLSELTAELTDTLAAIEHPSVPVRSPASLEVAADLVRATVAVLERPGERDRRALGDDVNLAYATLLASVDLLKSHTETPRVPRRRNASTEPPAP